MNPFSWLRRLAAQAVTDGVADGLRAVSPDGEEVPDLDSLRDRLAAATQPKALESPKPKRRGE